MGSLLEENKKITIYIYVLYFSQIHIVCILEIKKHVARIPLVVKQLFWEYFKPCLDYTCLPACSVLLSGRSALCPLYVTATFV